MLKAILFDHDGTTVDSERPHYEMWKDVMAKYDISLTYDDYNKNYAGVPTPRLSGVLVEKYSLNVAPQELYDAKMTATNEYLAERAYPLMPGAFEAMQYFHDQGLAIAIVTGSAKEGVNSTITKHGLEKYVSAVVSRDDVKETKPAPDSYQLAAERLGCKPEDCLAIEDTFSGSLSASSAGVKCVGVSSSATVRSKFTETVHVCASLDEAKQWITENFQITGDCNYQRTKETHPLSD